jgi:hypothetical protein
MNEAVVGKKDFLTLTTGDGKDTFVLDFTIINQLESRVEEIRVANPLTLPDLIVDFTVALSKIGDLIGQVRVELNSAERELEITESISLLERVEESLKNKKVRSSADTRKAQVAVDPEVLKAKERRDILIAVMKLLENKHDAIEMAYYGAKKVCDFTSLPIQTKNYAGSRK